jgi:pimeloyl-ACP methyl ester carboxylesterase
MDVGGVFVEVTGDGPETVVLLHGFSDNANTWRRVVPELATRYRVIALDLPGHGRSTRAWTRPLVEGYADDVASVLDGLGVNGAVALVGNSMGGCVATVFADRYPERTERIAVIGMPGLAGVPLVWRLAATRPSVGAMRTVLAPIPIHRLQRGFGWIYAHAATPNPGAIDSDTLHDYFDTYADRDKLFGLGEIARALLGELRTLRLDQVLARSSVPTLQIWGRHDRLVPSRQARRGAGAVVLPGCGHCPQLDAPDQLLATLLPFLAQRTTGDERLGGAIRAMGS